MVVLRTPLSVLEAATQSHGPLPLLKVPRHDSLGTEWKDVSYAEFWHDIGTHAQYWAYEFSKQRWQKQSVVGIWLKGTSFADLLTIWAISRAGFIPQLISIRMPNPDVVYGLLNRAGAVALIAEESFGPILANSSIPVLFSTKISSDMVDNLAELPSISTEIDPNQVMTIVHTSGSTSGSPKLVPLTAQWIDCQMSKISHFTKPRLSHRQQIIVSGGSFCHLASNLVFWSYIQRGGCFILPSQIPYSSLELRHMVSKCGMTALNMFSSFLSKLFVEARRDNALLQLLKSLEYIVHSGLPLPAEDVAWGRAQSLRLTNVFASTEVGAMLHSDNEIKDALVPFPGSCFEFVPLRDTLASRQMLELVVPPESADCPPPAFRNPETGKFHTGDLFIEAWRGKYFSKGRKDDWIKMEGGLRCDTAAIEDNAVQTCGGDLIEAAVVVGAGRPAPVLIVEQKECNLKSAALKAEILRRTAPFHTRRYIHERVDSPTTILLKPKGTFPRTATKGNIRRALVEEQFILEIDAIFKPDA
ncbi:hypothetical protein NLG97_g5438 [Lecanicillium saksenae]|uniref:Uncharacterized protein n=1 Tax=Lecanicillium saksenae TaxID=468837 RepID=A0ACC1QVN5_9HYPO|nr:hypothetical protein NLG97_g5438 [Lecanicillium saksenae]